MHRMHPPRWVGAADWGHVQHAALTHPLRRPPLSKQCSGPHSTGVEMLEAPFPTLQRAQGPSHSLYPLVFCTSSPMRITHSRTRRRGVVRSIPTVAARATLGG